jgi:hypothetical protein
MNGFTVTTMSGLIGDIGTWEGGLSRRLSKGKEYGKNFTPQTKKTHLKRLLDDGNRNDPDCRGSA